MLAAPTGSTPWTSTAGCPSPQPAGDAGEQAAAADRDDHQVRRAAELLDDLDRDRALAGDGPQVVEGGHEQRRRSRAAAASAIATASS